MNYDQYRIHCIKDGCWPQKKQQMYEEVREIALRDAASAIGIKFEILVAMVESNK